MKGAKAASLQQRGMLHPLLLLLLLLPTSDQCVCRVWTAAKGLRERDGQCSLTVLRDDNLALSMPPATSSAMLHH